MKQNRSSLDRLTSPMFYESRLFNPVAANDSFRSRLATILLAADCVSDNPMIEECVGIVRHYGGPAPTITAVAS